MHSWRFSDSRDSRRLLSALDCFAALKYKVIFQLINRTLVRQRSLDLGPAKT